MHELKMGVEYDLDKLKILQIKEELTVQMKV